MHVSLGRAGDGSGRDYALQAVRRATPPWPRGQGLRRAPRPAAGGGARGALTSPTASTRTSPASTRRWWPCCWADQPGREDPRPAPRHRRAGELPGGRRRRVYAVGNSGGGTLAWYAACVEPRLRGLILGSCFATYAASIGSVDHCCDNYLPGALRWFDFPDLAALVAPAAAGRRHGPRRPLFPLAGVEAAYRRPARSTRRRRRGPLPLILCEGGHGFRPARPGAPLPSWWGLVGWPWRYSRARARGKDAGAAVAWAPCCVPILHLVPNLVEVADALVAAPRRPARMAWVFLAPNLLTFGLFTFLPIILNFAYAATGGGQHPPGRPRLRGGRELLDPAELRQLPGLRYLRAGPVLARDLQHGLLRGAPGHRDGADLAADGPGPEPRDPGARLLPQRVLLSRCCSRPSS
jgi:hypothetical protein